MSVPSFAPGWRFSILDGIVLVAGTIAAIGFGSAVWWIGFVIGFTIAHFFLFCNVIRMSRFLELVWSATFVAVCSSTIILEIPSWLLTAVCSLCVTLVVVVLEIRKASYHGVGWRIINPGLPKWWEAKFPNRDLPVLGVEADRGS
jgi:hypothetical protein